MTYWITMTDKFMTGWGLAKGRISKVYLKADTYEEALIVAENAHQRTEMKNINIRTTKPYYPVQRIHLAFISKLDGSRWYQKGGFKK